MNIDKDIFEILVAHKIDNYAAYGALVEYARKTTHQARGNESAVSYEVLTKLSNSINNAGCELRRSEQITIIRNASSLTKSHFVTIQTNENMWEDLMNFFKRGFRE